MDRSKVQPATLPDHAGNVDSRRWGTGRSDPIARRLAPALGLREQTIAHMLRGPRAVNQVCARIIEAFQACDDQVRLVAFLQPIDLAIAKARPAQFTTDLVLHEQESDGDEDTAEALYLREPTADHARMYIKRLDRAIAASLQLRNSLAAQHELLPASPLKLQ